MLFLSVLCGIASLVGIPFLRESYDPILRRRKAFKVLSNPDPDPADIAAAKAFISSEEIARQKKGSKTQVFWRDIIRSVALLTTNLICFMLSLYMA